MKPWVEGAEFRRKRSVGSEIGFDLSMFKAKSCYRSYEQKKKKSHCIYCRYIKEQEYETLHLLIS